MTSALEKLFQLSGSGDVEGVAKTILSSNIDINATNKRKWTALHFAARFGQKAVIETLLRSGADKTLQNDEGKVPYDLAQLWGFPEAAELLKLTASSEQPSTEKATTTSVSLTASAIPSNFFAGSTIDRAGNYRKQLEWVEKAVQNASSKVLVLSGSKVLLKKDQTPGSFAVVFFAQDRLQSFVQRGLNYILLGINDSVAYFAVDINENEELEKEVQSENVTLQIIRPAAFQISILTDAALVAQARSILDWNNRNIFCPMCGQKTSTGEGGYKRICPNSECKTNGSIQNVSYPRLDPVVISLIFSPDRQKVLLGRGKQFPEGMFSCLAGFMEPGESIEEAVRREVVEESGIRVGYIRYHSSQPWPFPSQLMIGTYGQALNEDITIDKEELADCKWFTKAEVIEALKRGFDTRSSLLKIPPKYAIANSLIRAWIEDHPVAKF